MTHPRLAALALLALLAAPASAAQTYKLSGDDVSIWNPAGEVRIEGTTASQVEVLVTLAGPDMGEIQVSTDAVDGRPALRVLYSGRRIVYPPMGRWSNTNTSIRNNGTWGGGHDWSGDRRITVAGSGDGIEAWADLVVRVPKGRKVSVYTLAGGGEIQGVDGRLRFDGGSGGVRASACRNQLSIDVGSGGVQVEDFSGELLVDTGSGSVRADKIRGTSARLDTGSGGVTGDGIVVEDLDVDTGSGSVEILGLDAKRVRVETGSGGVEIALLTEAPDLMIDTGSGSVRVTAPRAFSARLHLETGSGGIRSELPLTVDEKDHGILRGTVGSGAGSVRVDTGSGSVSILASNTPAKSKSK